MDWHRDLDVEALELVEVLVAPTVFDQSPIDGDGVPHDVDRAVPDLGEDHTADVAAVVWHEVTNQHSTIKPTVEQNAMCVGQFS